MCVCVVEVVDFALDSDLDDCSITVFCVGGRFYLSSKYNRLQRGEQCIELWYGKGAVQCFYSFTQALDFKLWHYGLCCFNFEQILKLNLFS